MKVTNWRRKLIETLVAGGMMAPLAANAANLEISRDRLLDLDGEICLGAQHQLVGTLHRTMQVDKNLRVRAYELHQFRSDPEGAQSLRHCDSDFTLERLSEPATAPEEALRRIFHSGGETKKFLPVFREPDAIMVACEQQDVELALQLLDALANSLAGHP